MQDLGNLVFSNTDFADFNGDDADVSGAAAGASGSGAADSSSYVHIRRQARNGRKCLTTVQGLPDDLDMKKIIKAMKRVYSTNGTLVKNADMGTILQLQGDQRKNVADFLLKYKICEKGEVKIHGF